jgi:cyanophycinase
MMTQTMSKYSNRARMSAAVLALAFCHVAASQGSAEDLSPAAETLGPAAPISGTLFICGGGKVPDAALARFVTQAGGANAQIVVITTASETADTEQVETRLEFWRKTPMAELTILHTRSREVADDPKFCEPLTTATGVWFIGGHQQRITEAYLGTRTEKAIKGVLKRGGVVGGTSAGAAIMSPVMIIGAVGAQPETGRGFGFLEGTIVDQHFVKRRRENRLLTVLNSYPKLVGLGIDENTVLVVQGRTLSVISDAKDPKSAVGDPRELKVISYLAPVGDKAVVSRAYGHNEEFDLLALSRSAIARVEPRFSFDDDTIDPEVSHGTLIVSGGGDVPEGAAERFIEAAGGPDATIVVVTTANGERLSPEARQVTWLAAAGAKDIHLVHPRTRTDAEAPALLALLKKAGGVWFTGGRQWRLVDALQDTEAEKEFHEVLNRGGVIGGSAGGASMLADYLVRGGPLSNKEIAAEGYEEGFGFLKGVAIDPFFTQRNRFADMASLKKTHPHLVGLGVDEGMAVIIKGRALEVVGRNQVIVYDRREPGEAEKGFKFLYEGDKYDLASRERLGPPRTTPETPVVAKSEPADADDPEPQPPLACE